MGVVCYYVVLPYLYYRQGRIRHQWRNERGQMISMHNLDPERQAQVRAPLQKLMRWSLPIAGRSSTF